MNEKPKIVCVVGPTAAGKTALAIELAQMTGGEIVSCDSMQIYKGMDIGTAKPSLQERRGVPHHMLDVARPEEVYSAARYAREASVCVDDILRRGKLPIVTGGTGLYLRALEGGLKTLPPGPPELRAELARKAAERGAEAMHALLREKDPERAKQLHPNDCKRVLRALEIIEQTGGPYWESVCAGEARYEMVKLGISFRDRALLYDRIHKRVDDMFARGLPDEVERLLKAGLSAGCTAMQAIGYKELACVFHGEKTLPDAAELIKKRTRHYAKRQMTWFGADPSVHWIWAEDEKNIEHSTEFLRISGLR